ncbi:MAG TPA: neutral/alkaline non-lysosomal ceramidase N-terminal domain-containing protein [Verrucomicrobiae bacterium]|nr:neutral/alkaline non-lysosomal ceramidase N-terminal domain-containing protein [Verrucomicrobiae bacterium]
MSFDQHSFQAGVARRCANPPPNIAHGGWGAQKHEQAEGIDMGLWTTALALSDGITTAMVLDLDLQILTNERADQIRSAVSRATGLPITNIRASATHTHTGPVPYKSWIEKGFELVAPWFELVARRSAEAAREAIENLQPARVRAGRGQCFINANRRAATATGERFLGINPDGPCDREVIVIRLDKTNHEPLATIVNYACHPTIMGPPTRRITPDYPGAMKRVVEQAVGGTCLFLQGAAGDQGPMRGFQGDYAVYRNFGAILGHEAARVALALAHLPSSVSFREIIPSGAPLGIYDAAFDTLAGAPVRVIAKEIAVPLREGLPGKREAAEKLEFWKAKLKTARVANDAPAITEATYMARRADIQLRMADDFGGKTTAGVRTHFIRFGDVCLVACNIEPFCEIGMAIKRDSAFPVTLVSGYSNGRMAYMATPAEWPKGGYEVDNSPFGEMAGDALATEILGALKTLRAEGP